MATLLPGPGEPGVLTMDNVFYILQRKSDPWGGYGDMLMHGMAGRTSIDAGEILELQRAGPFVPPISQPGLPGIVVTDDFRKQIEQSSLKGITFRPVQKTRIVNIAWHDGLRDADEPLRYPKEGEPENYILRLPHHRGVAEQIGVLWELAPRQVCYTTRGPRIVQSNNEITLVTEGWDGSDVFLAEGVLYCYVSGRARDWLLAHVPEYVDFESAVTSPTKPPDQERR